MASVAKSCEQNTFTFKDAVAAFFAVEGLLPTKLMSYFLPNCDCRDFGLFLTSLPNC